MKTEKKFSHWQTFGNCGCLLVQKQVNTKTNAISTSKIYLNYKNLVNIEYVYVNKGLKFK